MVNKEAQDNLLTPELARLGFQDIVNDAPAYRAVCSSTAKEKTGKTYFGMDVPGTDRSDIDRHRNRGNRQAVPQAQAHRDLPLQKRRRSAARRGRE